MSKALAAVLTVLLSFSCVSTYPRPKVPWPGKYTTEVLWFCTQEGMWETYNEEPPSCPPDRRSRGEWDLAKLPLSVNSEGPLERATESAVLAINATLGFEMLSFQVDNLDPDIAVVPRPTHPLNPVIAYAVRGTIDGVDHGVVVVLRPVTASVLMHELGHLLGLRHDPENRSSLMHPSDIALVMEPADVAVLRELYATGLPE